MLIDFTPLRRTARSLGLATVGVLSTLGALSLTHVGPVQAQSPGVSLASLVAQINTLKTQQAADEATITFLQNNPTPGPKGDTGPAGPQGPKGSTGPQGVQGPAGDSPFTVSGTDVTLSGYNLHIVDGTGSTSSTSGLGNVIIGYNASGNSKGDVRTGSHNLIVGDQNSYSSYGGLIAGNSNTLSGPYASVSGGEDNTASGFFASVSGGFNNVASGGTASVSGGNGNAASGTFASVSGGFQNTASGSLSSVSGGNSLNESINGGWSAGSLHSL